MDIKRPEWRKPMSEAKTLKVGMRVLAKKKNEEAYVKRVIAV